MSSSNDECLCCKALWITFKLCQDLTCASDKVCARVVDHWQGELPPTDSSCTAACDGVTPTTNPTVNVYNLEEGAGGAYVFAGPKNSSGIASYDDIEDKYRIVFLEPPKVKVAVGIRYDTTSNCQLQLRMHEIKAMYCDPPEWGCVDTQQDPNGADYCIPMYSRSAVSSVVSEDTVNGTSPVCRIRQYQDSFCAFDPPNPGPPTTVIDFQSIDVVVDVYDDASSDCVKTVTQAIYVACIETETIVEDLFCWTDCETPSSSGASGSGSGSGS